MKRICLLFLTFCMELSSFGQPVNETLISSPHPYVGSGMWSYVTMTGSSLTMTGDVNGDQISDLVGKADNLIFQIDGKDNSVICTLPSSPYGAASISAGGDLDGDGVGDILVGRTSEPGNTGLSFAGRVYAYSGSNCSYIFDIGSDLEQNFGLFGSSVLFVGDVDIDGIDDFVVRGQYFYQGYNWVYSGRTRERLFVLVDQEGAGFSDYPVFVIRDINDDGIGELVLSLGSEAHIVNGSTGRSLYVIPVRLRFAAHTISSIDDVDGDGVPDIVAGDSGSEYNGLPAAGSVRIFSGRKGNLVSELYSPQPFAYANFGSAVAVIPDADNDGIQDILVSSSELQIRLFGSMSGELLAERVVLPDPEWEFGPSSIFVTGDMNDDGVPDIITSQYQGSGLYRNFVWSGKTLDMFSEVRVPFSQWSSQFGWAFSRLKSTDGSCDDIVFGAPGETIGSIFFEAGRAYSVDGCDSQSLTEFVSPSPKSSARFGESVASIQDYAGVSRVAIGAPGGGSDSSGRVYVYDNLGNADFVLYPPSPSVRNFGSTLEAVPSLTSNGDNLLVAAPDSSGNGHVFLFDGFTGDLLHTITLDLANDGLFGASLSSADINNDQVADWIVGAPHDDSLAYRAGAVYVFDGVSGNIISRIVSPNPSDNGMFGYAVSSIHDYDSDAFPDLAIGAPGEAQGFSGVGRVYIVSCRSGAALAELVPTLVSRQKKEKFGIGIELLDDVNGDGYPEIGVGSGFNQKGSVIVFGGKDGLQLKSYNSDGESFVVGPDRDSDGVGEIWVRINEDGGYVFPQLSTQLGVGIETEETETNEMAFQNYPNPFRNRTTFHYSLSTAGSVDLSIFDVLGRRVANVIAEDLAAGAHHFDWSTDLSSGVYFARLRSRDKIITTKLVIAN